MSIMHCSLLSLGCAFGFAPPNEQTSLTFLPALKIAQRRLRPEVRSKLMGVTSSRTWRFVFFDQGTSGHCRVVTVAAKTSSEHPDTVEAFSSSKTESVTDSHPITQNKCVVDSGAVLVQIRSVAKLKGVRAAEYRLSQARSGQEPLWTVSFYAENSELVARFQVGAKTGVVKILPKEASNGTHPNGSHPREVSGSHPRGA
jgi:hypothetical protein